MFKLYIGSRTGIITSFINGETANFPFEGMCVEVGFSEYINVFPLVEAAMNKIGVDVGVELVAVGVNFRAISEVMWLMREGEDHLRIGVHFMGMNRGDLSLWNKVPLSLGEKAQTREA